MSLPVPIVSGHGDSFQKLPLCFLGPPVQVALYWPSYLLGSCRLLGPTRLGIPPSLAPEVDWDLSLVDIRTRRLISSLRLFLTISRMREVVVHLLEYPKENKTNISELHGPQVPGLIRCQSRRLAQ